MKKIIRILVNLIYPTKCIFCGKVTEFGKEVLLCPDCKSKITFCDASLCCRICGKPQISLGEKEMCYDCLTKTYRTYKRTVSVVKYDELTASGIKRYKDGASEISCKVFADLMAKRIKTEFGKIEFDYIAGVAPSRKRSIKRGFEPVGEICKRLSKHTGIPYLKGALVKIKNTPKQSSLDYEHRLKNLIGSIALKKGTDINGKRILLVDDVMTTGSTINENAFILKGGGAKEVYAVTFATTIKERKTYKNIKQKTEMKV